MSLTTCRNICSLAGHAVACCRTSYEARLLQELPIEFHFGRLKAHCQGSPSIKDGVMAMAVETAKQERLIQSCEFGKPKTEAKRDALTVEEVVLASKKALASSLQFQACICADTTPEDLYQHLRRWWPSIGQGLLTQLDRDSTADDLDPDCAELTLAEIKQLMSGTVTGPEEATPVLQNILQRRCTLIRGSWGWSS